MIFVSVFGSGVTKVNIYDKVFGWPVTLILTSLLVIEVVIAGYDELQSCLKKVKGKSNGSKGKKRTEKLKKWVNTTDETN